MPSRRSPGPGQFSHTSRYTLRVAISNGRLIPFNQRRVTFRYKYYRRVGADRQQISAK